MIHYSFDVYSFDGDRWSLASSFSMTQKDEAFRFLQRLYSRPQIKGVRIIQETFDSDLGGSARKPLLSRIKTEATPPDDELALDALATPAGA